MMTAQAHSCPTADAIYSHETIQLAAVGLAVVGFANRVLLGSRAAAQRRDLRSSASRLRLHVSRAGSAGSVRRRRTWYQRAHEQVASFAFVLLDLRQADQIGQADFESGRRLAARAKFLLDAQLAALRSVPLDAQEDPDKLDEVMLAADRTALVSGPPGADAKLAAPSRERAPSTSSGRGAYALAVDTGAPAGTAVISKNGGSVTASLASETQPVRPERRSARHTT